MLLKTILVKPVKILIGTPTVVRVNDEIQFDITVHPTVKGYHLYQIENTKGNFEVDKITVPEEGIILPYDKHDKRFASNYHFEIFEFHILTDVEFNSVKEDTFIEKVSSDLLRIKISREELNNLRPFECYKNEIEISENVHCTAYLKKLEDRTMEIHVVNPGHLTINEENGDFRLHFGESDPIAVNLNLDLTKIHKKQSISA